VLHHHHANWIIDGAKRAEWRRRFLRIGLGDGDNVGKE